MIKMKMSALKQNKNYTAMQNNKYKNQYSFFEQRLLSIQSGMYLNIEEILHIAKDLGFNLPHKSRELTLQKLLLLSKEQNLNNKLSSLFLETIEQKKQEYINLYTSYKNAEHLLSSLLQQLQATKMMIIKELHVRNIYDT